MTWWLKDAMVDGSYLQVAPGVVSNNLVISPLSRSHAHSKITCQAAPAQVAIKTISATIDMHRK